MTKPNGSATRFWRKSHGVILAALLLGGLPAPLRAIIFYSTGDPSFNTTAPTGALSNCGWQWVGNWGGYAGTPIGPHHFLAAHHVGGAAGDPFIYGGVTYTTTAFYDDPASDLRIWAVNGTFPDWAPLYRSIDEKGRALVVIGRGLGRGAEVRVNGVLKGWQWGGNGNIQRWGQNAVAQVVSYPGYWGDLLYATFDEAGGANEAHLAVGDSSGPVFINDGTGWKLAGLSAAVDSYFNTTDTGSGFNAAIFDMRGLYFGDTGNWALQDGPAPVPSGFYATRVSVRAAWIDGIVPPPANDGGDAPLLPPAGTIILVGLLLALGSRALARRRVT